MHSSPPGAVSRRHLARLAICAAVGAFVADPSWPAPRPLVNVANWFRDSTSAHRIGRRYLASVSTTPDKNSILTASPALARAVAEPSRAQAKALLRQAVAEDFRRGDIVVVDGWVLAASEARLCALVAIG